MVVPELAPGLDPRALASVASGARDELAIRHLAHFVRWAWDLIEPETPLTWNWHIDLICRELEAVSRGEVRELVICIPPGHMKSLIVAVFWPAWMWLRRPGLRLLSVSNSDGLAERDNRRTRDVVVSPAYRRLVATQARLGATPAWGLKRDQNEKVNFENTVRGFRQCLTMGAKITGFRPHGILIDDPIDAKEAILGSSEQIGRRMADVWTTYGGALSTRLADRKTGWRVTIMQRLHEDDLAGRLLGKPGVRAVVLPSEFEPDSPRRHPDDPRRAPGELLFPALFGVDVLADLKTDLTPRHYAAQHQQRPSPAAGGMFQRAWFKTYSQDPARMAADCEEIAITVDCAFRDTKTADFVVLQVWGRRAGKYFLLDQVRGRMDYVATREALRRLAAKWPRAALKLVEGKANGDALIADLKNSGVPGLVAFDPKGSKEARASVASRFWAAGDVLLPEARYAPWIGDFVEEHAAFPHGAHDDQVDPGVQLLLYWNGSERTAESARNKASIYEGVW